MGQRRLTDAVFAQEQRQVVRQASPWKKTAVFWEKEHGLFGKRTRSFLRMTAVGLATQGMPRRQGHAWCAPAGVLVRTICRFGAHHLMLWCAPKLQAMRTRIHKIQLLNPAMFEKSEKTALSCKLSKITEAIYQMQCVLEAFRPCERGHIRRYIKQGSSAYEVQSHFQTESPWPLMRYVHIQPPTVSVSAHAPNAPRIELAFGDSASLRGIREQG